jgi:hypothetical protein
MMATINRELLWLSLGVLVIGGGIALWLGYGTGPALIGLVCLVGGAAMILILWVLLTLVGKWAGTDD